LRIGFISSSNIEFHRLLDFLPIGFNESPNRVGSYSLILFFYLAFTGWNSAAYIVEEIDQPRKNSSQKALISSTIFSWSVRYIYSKWFLKTLALCIYNISLLMLQVATIVLLKNIFGPQEGSLVSVFFMLSIDRPLISDYFLGLDHGNYPSIAKATTKLW